MKYSKYITYGVLFCISLISLILSIYFGSIVNTSLKKAHWVLSYIFVAFSFVSAGLLIGALLYDKHYKYEFYVSLLAFVASFILVFIVFYATEIFSYSSGVNPYNVNEMTQKLVPMLYLINGISVIGIIKTTAPRVKKLIKK